MNKYIIAITQIQDKIDERGYKNKDIVYEQTIRADESIVSAIVQRVLDYMSVDPIPPIIKTGGKDDEGVNNSKSSTGGFPQEWKQKL